MKFRVQGLDSGFREIMQKHMEKNMDNEIETLGRFEVVYRDCVVSTDIIWSQQWRITRKSNMKWKL